LVDPADSTFLASLEPDELASFRERARPSRYPAQTAIFHEGDDPGNVVLLVSGRVKVSMPSRSGREVVLGFSGPGELIGEIAAVDGAPRSATVTTLEPVEALRVSARDFSALVESHPRLMRLLLRSAATRLRSADRDRVEFAAHDTLGRVAWRLLDLCERFGQRNGDQVVITLPISQEELAGWAGASREALAKALQTLRSLEAIETDRRRITVRQLEALERMAR
jgi:CRP/FNR family cyclic AMP-dependent transcriptional regulator